MTYTQCILNSDKKSILTAKVRAQIDAVNQRQEAYVMIALKMVPNHSLSMQEMFQKTGAGANFWLSEKNITAACIRLRHAGKIKGSVSKGWKAV
jgi:alpha-D-ribose 1-methylphosphonate 5-triphosphate synthase subunit PhnG